MPHVRIDVVTGGADPAEVYERICDFGRYPELTSTVRRVTILESQGPDRVVSAWEVTFREGLLHWTERDVFDRPHRMIRFEQLTGDLEVFEGHWAVSEHPDGAAVRFEASFDLGIPSLAPIVDPIAEATLRSNILLILQGLLGSVTELSPSESSGVPGSPEPALPGA